MPVRVYLLAPNDTPYFYAQWLPPGSRRRKTKSLKTADPGEADRLRADLEYELNHGLHHDRRRVTWAEFVLRLEGERLADISPEGRARVLFELERFQRAHGPASPADVDSEMVSKYAGALRRSGMKPSTVQTITANLRSALRWAARVGMIRQAPHFEPVNVITSKRVVTLTSQRYPLLLAAMPTPDWRLFCQIAWHTGMRLGEVCSLRWDEDPEACWLDLAANRVRFPAAACKGRRDDWLPIHPDLLAELLPLRRESGRVCAVADRRGKRNVSQLFCRYGKPVGVKTHDLRRAFGTRYAPLVPAHILQRLMRHAKIETTLKYYVDLDPALEQAILLA